MQKAKNAEKNCNIKVSKNGPYLVTGAIPIFNSIIECNGKGIPARWFFRKTLKTTENYTLCRCGQSSHKPFCDGTHSRVNFDGTETSLNESFDKMAKEIEGPDLMLKDAEILCASARFCHRGGDIWENVPKSDKTESKKNAIEDACDCPSGRLVIIDKKIKKIIEPDLSKSIGVIEDPSKGVEGPYWIRGGIPVYSANEKLYEVRNRVTLCRCGKSSNKPFCDSSHYPEEDDREK